MEKIRVALTNLGKYNEGQLVYEWLELPATDEEIEDVLENIGINNEYKEFFISDYKAPFSIGEFDCITKLNGLAKELEMLDDSELLAFNAYIEGVYNDTEEALEVAISGDYSIHYDVDDMEDVAIECVDQGLFDIDRNNPLTRYIDYKRLGRDLSFDSTFVFIDGDCVEFYNY